jgi:hypothetical protein
VDCSGGLARRGNRRLRQALLWGADTLIRCNDHFRVLAARWSERRRDPRAVRVQVAGRYARIAFQMVSGTAGFRHPACQGPPAVLAKLIEFHDAHEMDIEMTRTNLRRAVAQLPAGEGQREQAELAARVREPHPRRGRKLRRRDAVATAVLPPLGAGGSPPSGAVPSGEDGADITVISNIASHDDNNDPTAQTAPAPSPARGPVDRSRRGHGPTPLSELLPAVFEQWLGGEAAAVRESTESGETP